MDYVFTYFGLDSSSRIPLEHGQTGRQTTQTEPGSNGRQALVDIGSAAFDEVHSSDYRLILHRVA